MSISVKLYKFSKRENSTAVPSGSAGTTFNCLLKEETSVLSPEILLKHSGYPDYNYAYIATFGRYYFIKDIISDSNDHWRISLDVDVLGSWKSNIGSSSEYVLRAASDFDINVIDSLYPINAEVTYGSSGSFSPAWGYNNSYIIGIINNDTNCKRGSVTYYSVNETSMGSLMSFLLGATSYMNIDPSESSPEYIKATVNPSQYIVDFFYLPYAVNGAGTASTLKFGWWDSNISATAISMGSLPANSPTFSGSITIPMHPLRATRGRSYRCAPYTRYMLYAGPFGEIPIDPAQISESDSLSFEIYCNDFGDAVMYLKTYGGALIGKYRANIKEQYIIGQVNNDPAKFWSGIAGLATPMMSAASNPVGAIAGITSGILDNAANLYPQARTFGSDRSCIDLTYNWELVGEFHYPVDFDDTHRGRPLCQVKTISSLSGYILVSDPDIAIPGTAAENEKIKNYMASGFYYE